MLNSYLLTSFSKGTAQEIDHSSALRLVSLESLKCRCFVGSSQVLEGLVDQGCNGDRFKANLDVPSVALRHLSGENLGTVLGIKVA